MSGLTRYIVWQISAPAGIFTLALSGVIWLTQSLRMLEVITSKSQTAGTFLALSALVMPSVLAMVMPIGFFAAVLFALNRMRNDHELVVLMASGQSAMAVARPILGVSAVVAGLVLVINLAAIPAAKTGLRDLILEIRTDLAATLLHEGTFSNPIPGLTVYIRGRNSAGDMLGILVHDNRDLENPTTYMAERGQLVDAVNGPRLIMANGNLQRRSLETGNLSLLYFDRYVYDLSEFIPDQTEHWREPEERYLGELFYPAKTMADQSHLPQLLTEGHKRLSSPLYAPAFAMLAAFALLSGQYSRRAQYWRLGATFGFAVLFRLAGLGMENLTEKNGWMSGLLYLWPLLLSGACLYLMTERGARAWASWLRALRRQPSLAQRVN